MGGSDAKLLHTKQSLMSLMTEWVLASKAAGNFELDDSCQLTGVTRFDGLIK
ncbi:recombination-associated protein RdgC, partial [Kingella kingae]|uniref:recombination-associated protein RdgC n=1 Tax=Kingella kingae TaxID=504 RepID=UPI0031376FAB